MEGVDAARLRASLEDDLQRCLEKVAKSVTEAADGRWIADSEEISRDALQEFAQLAYQKAMQQKIEAAEAAFSPSGGRNDRKAL
jgi:hypothetical protein